MQDDHQSNPTSTRPRNPKLLSKLGDDAESLYTAIYELFAGREIQLPVLPSNVSRLIAACGASSPDMDDITQLVALDPGLCSHVFRLVNSASMSPVAEIDSLDDAVRRLGTRVIADLAVSESLQHCLSHRTCPRTRAHLRFSAVAGVYSFQIGRLCGSARTASLLPGLMHDIGKPIATTLLAALKELPEWGLTDEAVELLADEMHIPVGLRLVREWNLPSHVETAISFHEDPSEAPDGSREAYIAHLSTLFAAWTFAPEDTEGSLHPEVPSVRALGLSQDDLEALFGHLDDALEAARAFG